MFVKRFTLSLLIFSAAGIVHAGTNGLYEIRTVFLIVLENVNWSGIKGNASAPYINNTLLPMASYAEQYFTPPGLPGSLPNYLWLEAGTNFGVLDSNEPKAHTFATTNHLAAQLDAAGISWRAYQENISGTICPTNNSGLYAAYHNPFVYFDDVITNGSYCLSHIRPYTEFSSDLTNHAVARYNFITPNLCNDMHNSSGCATTNRIRNGDNWLSVEIPKILSSTAYQNNGALFITWDEGVSPALEGPIGMLVLSPRAKGGGYSNSTRYTHGSMTRTLQEIFGVRPFLAGAAAAPDLADLFLPNAATNPLKIAGPSMANGIFSFTVSGIRFGATNVIESSETLVLWNALRTNRGTADSFQFSESVATNASRRFYRVRDFSP